MVAWLQIGKVGKAHGLRGHFFVSYRAEPLPEQCKEIRVGKNPEQPAMVLSVDESKLFNNRVVMHCAEISDRTAAEKITGEDLWVNREDVEDDNGTTMFWSDFIGKPIIDSDGVTMGTVSDVQNFGASDILIVADPSQKSLLNIPLILQYVNLEDFESDQKQIRLKVPAETFAEFWHA